MEPPLASLAVAIQVDAKLFQFAEDLGKTQELLRAAQAAAFASASAHMQEDRNQRVMNAFAILNDFVIQNNSSSITRAGFWDSFPVRHTP